MKNARFIKFLAAERGSRQFDPDGPDRLWVMDVTEHPTDTGKVYCAAGNRL